MDTTFINGTVVVPEWLNDVNRSIYKDILNVKNALYGAKGDGTTDDTAAVIAAVADAFSNSIPLNWPPGTYLTTSNIPYFNLVRHVGLGIVQRGADLFYITPQGGQTNSVYVSPSGADTNDGLSASMPKLTLQAAFNIPMTSGVVNGTYIINLAAGTYTSGGQIGPSYDGPGNDPDLDPYQRGGVVAVNYITLRGPDVGYAVSANPTPVPTAIFDGGGAAAVGVLIAGCGTMKMLIKDIKFQNYSGSSSSAGISSAGAQVRCENIHGSNNYYDISGERGRLEVKGGTLNAATGAAIRSIFLNKHEIGEQNAGAPGQGPFITNAAIGLRVQEGSTGHSDFVNYTNCAYGIFGEANARVNYTGSVFTNCAVGIRSMQAYMYAGTSTFTGCTENKITHMLGLDSPRQDYNNAGFACNYLNAPNTLTGTLVSTAVITKAIVAGDWAPVLNSTRKPQHLEFEFFGTQTGTFAKQHKIRIGSTLICDITNTPTDTGDWRIRGSLYFMGTTLQQGFIEYLSHGSPVKISVGSAALDTKGTDWNITYEQQLTDVGDGIITLGGHIKSWG